MDMTKEEARKLVYDLTQYVDGRITSSEEIKAMEMLIEDSKKLSVYENADLIERSDLISKKLCGYCYGNDDPTSCSMDNCHKALETMKKYIPKFKPEWTGRILYILRKDMAQW